MENKFRLASKSDGHSLSEWVSKDEFILMWERLNYKNSCLLQSDILDLNDDHYIIAKTGNTYVLQKIDR